MYVYVIACAMLAVCGLCCLNSCVVNGMCYVLIVCVTAPVRYCVVCVVCVCYADMMVIGG